MSDTEWGSEQSGQGVCSGTAPYATQDDRESSQTAAAPEDYLGECQGQGVGVGSFARACADAQSINSVTTIGSQYPFGDGSDGDYVIHSGETLTLTRNMYFNDLTIESGGILRPNGSAVYVKGTFNCIGTVSSNGNDGADGSGGVGGSGGMVPYSGSSFLNMIAPQPSPGGRGATPSSSGTTNGTAKTASPSILSTLLLYGGAYLLSTGSGGCGGSAHGAAGGLVGNASAPSLCGSTGGDGGAAIGATSLKLGGGGGGSSGGFILIYAYNLIGAGLFEANGGNGGGGEYYGPSNQGGNGGGGGGGNIIVFYHSLGTTYPGTHTWGGAAGTTGNGGTAGGSGGAFFCQC